MHFDRPTLKREARQAMSAARPRAMLITLLYLLLTTGLSIPAGFVATNPAALLSELTRQGLSSYNALHIMFRNIGSTGLFLHILITLFSMIVQFGYQQWALNVSRMRSADISDLVCGFSMVGRILLLNILLFLYRLALTIVFTMVAQLAALPFLWSPPLSSATSIFSLLFASLAPYFLMLRYSMAAYCLMDDPGLSPLQAMRRSRQLTAGHLSALILLNLSFAGWILLGVMITVAALFCVSFPLGAALSALNIGTAAIIGSTAAAAVLSLAFIVFALWLLSYISVTECKFYDRLLQIQPNKPPFEL